jgi:hypothetical protein
MANVNTAPTDFQINKNEEEDDDEEDDEWEDELDMIEEDMQQAASIIPETSSIQAVLYSSSSSVTADNRFQFVPMTLAAESSRTRAPLPAITKPPHTNVRRKKHKPMANSSNKNTTVSLFKMVAMVTLVFFFVK